MGVGKGRDEGTRKIREEGKKKEGGGKRKGWRVGDQVEGGKQGP
jgi:hypothetical protein